MQVNVHDSILLHLQSIPLFLCHQKKLTSDTFELLLLLIVLRCTGGVSTFSLSILNVSRISSSRKHWMVSSRLELSMFLASVSFRCSRRLLGVVVRLNGYFLASFWPTVCLPPQSLSGVFTLRKKISVNDRRKEFKLKCPFFANLGFFCKRLIALVENCPV